MGNKQIIALVPGRLNSLVSCGLLHLITSLSETDQSLGNSSHRIIYRDIISFFCAKYPCHFTTQKSSTYTYTTSGNSEIVSGKCSNSVST